MSVGRGMRDTREEKEGYDGQGQAGASLSDSKMQSTALKATVSHLGWMVGRVCVSLLQSCL